MTLSELCAYFVGFVVEKDKTAKNPQRARRKVFWLKTKLRIK